MSKLDALRESLIRGKAYGKRDPDKVPPRDQWQDIADKEINAMSIVELLEQLEYLEDAA